MFSWCQDGLDSRHTRISSVSVLILLLCAQVVERDVALIGRPASSGSGQSLEFVRLSSVNTITSERRGRVLLMGLNRVAKRNAFGPAMFHELARALGAFDADPELWCGVIFAHGDHFTGGIDLAQFAPIFELEGDPFALEPGEVDPFGLRNHLSKPLIMAVHGITFTIGIEMLLAADIRIAASGTRFAQLEVARGLYPLGGATFRLLREAGWGTPESYLLTGDEFGASEA